MTTTTSVLAGDHVATARRTIEAMRGAIVIAAIVAVAGTATAQTPTIDAAIAKARAENKPLVIEMGAAWCVPCRWFEKEVLTAAEVKRALRSVVFVRYDIDVAPGDAVATRYRVTGVPVFLVVARDGSIEARSDGIRARDRNVAIDWFVDFLGDAARGSTDEARLLGAIRAEPAVLEHRMALAALYRQLGRRKDAIAQLQAVIDAPPPADRDTIAEAASLLGDLVAADARIQAAVDTAVAFVRTYPDSPLSASKLAFVAVSGRLSPADAKQLVDTHLAALPIVRDPAEAVRVALLAGLRVEAAHRTRQWIDHARSSPTSRLLLAEIELDDGDVAAAREIVADVCRAAPAALELRCYALEGALAGGRNRSPGVERLRRAAMASLQHLEHPDVAPLSLGELDSLEEERGFGNAVAGALRGAGRACGFLVRRSSRIGVDVALPTGRGHPLYVDVYGEGSPELERCVRESITERELPAPPARLRGHVFAVIHVQPGDRIAVATRAKPVARPIGNGAALFAIGRAGSTDSIGVGVHGVLGSAPLASDLRFVFGWQFEAGVTGGDRRGGLFVARAMPGVGLPLPGGNGVLAAMVGGGGRTGEGPLVAEIPLELRLAFDVRRVRANLWARGSWLLGDDREPTHSAVFDADEAALGAGASMRVAGTTRLFFGAVYERRTIGHAGSVLVGMPIGELF
jgi:thiol-disulfide isomerase/thioredoxin